MAGPAAAPGDDRGRRRPHRRRCDRDVVIEIRPRPRRAAARVAACVYTALLARPAQRRGVRAARPAATTTTRSRPGTATAASVTPGRSGSTPSCPAAPAWRRPASTRVGVLPTHRRRGLLTAMMTPLLARCRGSTARCSPACGPARPSIYGRFGFGLAGEACEVAHPARARPARSPGPPAGSVRLLDRKEILDVVRPVYDRAASGRASSRGPVDVGALPPRRARRGRRRRASSPCTPAVDGVDDAFAHYTMSSGTERAG